jgi:UDP-glucose 4-epimerase
VTTVLVTGATGFIGLHVAKELAAAGRRVVAVDVNPPDASAECFLGEAGARVRFIQLDLTTPDELEAAAAETPDAIVHAAVVTSTPDVEARQPERVVGVNLVATAHMLKLAERTRTRRFIYISSSGVYGETDPAVALSETAPVRLGSLYVMTKYASEQLVAAANSPRLSAATLRIGAPYGPTERPTGARTVMSVIYALINAAVDGRAIRLRGPDRTRDWTYAGDIARAVTLLIDAPELVHRCYNVSSGATAPLSAVADALRRIEPAFSWRLPGPGTGCAATVDVDGDRVQRRGPLDTARIRALGFVPRYALDDGLRDTVQWLRRFRQVGSTQSSPGR